MILPWTNVHGYKCSSFLIAPSAPPQGLKQVAIASTWVTLNWQPPPMKERNGNIRHYLVFVTELETQRSFTLNSTMSNYRVENLHPFYTYNIRIAAVTVATGSRSDAIFIQTLEDGKCEQSVLT